MPLAVDYLLRRFATMLMIDTGFRYGVDAARVCRYCCYFFHVFHFRHAP